MRCARRRAIFSRTACASASCSDFALAPLRFSFGSSAILESPRLMVWLTQPRRLAQRLVDAVLPARAIRLKMIEHIAIDAQRHLFLGAGQRRRVLRNWFRRFGGGRLERRFGRKPRVAGPPCAVSIVVHGILRLALTLCVPVPSGAAARPCGP